MTARRAFTLIELTMVLAIIAVAGAIAYPRWADALGRYRAEAAARRIVADLALVRAAARAASSPRTITFQPGTASYSIPGLADPVTRGAGYTVSLAQPPYQATMASVAYTASTPLTFNAFGYPSAGGTITVTSRGFSKVVSIDASSGTATIQ